MSSGIIWNSALSVGITDIDEQHKVLLDYLNKLYECKSNNNSKAEAGAVLDGLVKYVDYHFNFEEELFTSCGFEKADAHKKEHAYYREEVYNLAKQYGSNSDLELDAAIAFLKDWLLKHIMVKDQVMAKSIRECAAKRA
jgi:hemerythrin